MENEEQYGAKFHLTSWSKGGTIGIKLENKKPGDITKLISLIKEGGNIFELIPEIPKKIFLDGKRDWRDGPLDFPRIRYLFIESRVHLNYQKRDYFTEWETINIFANEEFEVSEEYKKIIERGAIALPREQFESEEILRLQRRMNI